MLKRFSKEGIPAFGFFKWAKLQTGFKHSPDSYNLMVDSLGKSRKFALMWEIVEEMHKLGRMKDGFVVRPTLGCDAPLVLRIDE
ncbi:hypothetical protein LguiB_033001 [Lonicera macranthoides]